jgi:hypothetical protein
LGTIKDAMIKLLKQLWPIFIPLLSLAFQPPYFLSNNIILSRLKINFKKFAMPGNLANNSQVQEEELPAGEDIYC